MNSGNYMFELSDGDGGGSRDHWFYVFALIGDEDSSYPDEEESNDIAVLANPMEMEDLTNSADKEFTRGYMEGFTDGASDKDWFSFNAPYEENYAVMCMN